MSATAPINSAFPVDPGASQPQHIKVVVRLRPTPSQLQAAANSEAALDGGDAKQPKKLKGGDKKAWILQRNGAFDSLVQKGAARKVDGKTIFHFDQVFDEDTKTPLLYKSIARPMVKSVLAGRHGTIFAYGQTGSGKTFTMQGDGLAASGQAGIVQLVASDLFRFMRQDAKRDYTVKLSYVEIYNEKIRDLVVPGQKFSQAGMSRAESPAESAPSEVTVRSASDGSISLNCQQPEVTTVDEVLDFLISGNKKRMVAKTDMNQESSRSHAIFRLTIESRSKSDSDDSYRKSDFNLVDLAGSECVSTANTSGARQREGGKINQSLLALSSVIHALSLPPKRQTHINYRDSNLTRILQPHLSGNAEMAILCCASAAKNCLEETRSTLKFAARAKLVKMKPKVNEVQDDDAVVRKLQADLATARSRIKAVEEELEEERASKRDLQLEIDRMKLNPEASAIALTSSATPEAVSSSGMAINKNQTKREYTMPSSFGGRRIDELHSSVHNISPEGFNFDTDNGPSEPLDREDQNLKPKETLINNSKFQLDAVDPKAAQEAISRFMKGQGGTADNPEASESDASFGYPRLDETVPSKSPYFARDFPMPPKRQVVRSNAEESPLALINSKLSSATVSMSESDENADPTFDITTDGGTARTGGYDISRQSEGDPSWNSVTELNVIGAPHANKLPRKMDDAESAVPTEILTITTTNYEGNSIVCITDQLRDAEQKASFFAGKLEQSEDLIEALFRDLERARSCIHDLVYRNVNLSNRVAESQKARTKGAFWKEEAVLEQLWILKGAMYASLFFFVVGGYELFLVSTILMWLVLEYNLTSLPDHA